MKSISLEILNSLSGQAQASERRRSNLNMHESLDDNFHRFFNAMEPDTYVRPHRHDEPNKWELFLIVRGKACVLIFDDRGIIQERKILDKTAENVAIEIPPRTWHTLTSLEPGTILFEMKPGPYSASTDKDFATWAPKENEPEVKLFLEWYKAAQPGDIPPFFKSPP